MKNLALILSVASLVIALDNFRIMRLRKEHAKTIQNMQERIDMLEGFSKSYKGYYNCLLDEEKVYVLNQLKEFQEQKASIDRCFKKNYK